MRVLVVRHHREDDPGFVAEALRANGAELSIHRFPAEPLPDLDGVDHVVVLGSAWSVYDDDRVGSWIGEEMAWLRRAAADGVGVFGICFGAQVLAAAHGGSVEPAGAMEIGWTAVDPVPAPAGGRPANLAIPPDVVSSGPWFEFHGDRCVLPATATLLARTALCVQAFTIGRSLGVQYHPEVDADQLQRWLDEGSRETVEALGLDPADLVARTRAEEPRARRRTAALVDAYLAAFGG